MNCWCSWCLSSEILFYFKTASLSVRVPSQSFLAPPGRGRGPLSTPGRSAHCPQTAPVVRAPAAFVSGQVSLQMTRHPGLSGPYHLLINAPCTDTKLSSLRRDTCALTPCRARPPPSITWSLTNVTFTLPTLAVCQRSALRLSAAVSALTRPAWPPEAAVTMARREGVHCSLRPCGLPAGVYSYVFIVSSPEDMVTDFRKR